MSGPDQHQPPRGRLAVVSFATSGSRLAAAEPAPQPAAGSPPSGMTGPAQVASQSDAAETLQQREPSASQKRFMAILSGAAAGRRLADNDNGGSPAECKDDPAFAVGLVLHFWRFSRRGMPMPKRAMRLLERHAAAGDPTCILVRDWIRSKMAGSGRRPLWLLEGGRPQRERLDEGRPE